MGGVFYGEQSQSIVKKKASKVSLYVVRIDVNDNLVNARPCVNCLNMMKQLGIKKVYYSVEGKIICERVTSMISIQISAATKLVTYGQINNEIIYREIIKNNVPDFIRIENYKYFIEYNFANIQIKVSRLRICVNDNNINFMMGNEIIKSCVMY